MAIGEVISEGNQDIITKEETFMQRLETEKDEFCKTLLTFDETFEQIIKFNSLDQVVEFSKLAYTLFTNITNSKDKIEQFNEREATFNQQLSEYT